MSTHLASSAQALGQVATVASDPFPESWGQAQASSEFAAPQLPLSRAGQSRAAQLMGILGGLRRAQVPLPRAARCPGVTAALHRDAEMRRLWVFWCLSTSPRQTGRAAAHGHRLPGALVGACTSVPGTPHSAQTPGGAHTALPGRSLRCPSPVPALCAAGALCLLSTSE